MNVYCTCAYTYVRLLIHEGPRFFVLLPCLIFDRLKYMRGYPHFPFLGPRPGLPPPYQEGITETGIHGGGVGLVYGMGYSLELELSVHRQTQNTVL